MTDPPDESLMLLAAGGDMDAFSRLVEKYRVSVLNFFVRLGVSTSDAEDLAQLTFVRVWKARGRYSADAKFTTFLFTVARNARIDHVRRLDARKRIEENWREREAVSGAGRRAGGGPGLRRAAAALPPVLRETVELAVFQELQYAEIGKILGVPVGTVKSRMFNAVSKMKEWFSKNPEER